MKRLVPFLALVGGVLAMVVLWPTFDYVRPRPVKLTSDEALQIADRSVRGLGVDATKSWRTITWETSQIIDQELGGDRARRASALADPVVGPRIGSYHVVYFHRGLEKYPNIADVYVSGETGEILGARRRARNDEKGTSPTEEQLRPVADHIVRGGLPGAPNPVFESARPTVIRDRTDWQFRYHTKPQVDMGRVDFNVAVYFIGGEYAGWMQIEEYIDGAGSRGDATEVFGTIGRFAALYVLLLILLVMFLKKYHAGEVGVRTGSGLFALAILLSICFSVLFIPPASIGTGFGSGLDAQQTALAFGTFKFLFYDVPFAVLLFFAWAVGESLARERWGERLASFDAILRRDSFNATVGRSLFCGLLYAPAVAGSTLLVSAIPVWLGYARPILPNGTSLILGAGGPLAALLAISLEAMIASVAILLFTLAWFNRMRLLPLGIAVAAVMGAVAGIGEGPIAPTTYLMLFGFGATLAAALVYLAHDLLTAATALFAGSLTLTFIPYLRIASGDAFTIALTTWAIPVAAVLIFSIAALLTKREVVYQYEDLAPHVKRIIERERVKAEIDAANRIQAALLPLDPPDVVGATVASHYRAATEIGGDYFDFLPQPNGEIGIAFGDVSGHGLTSGIVMSMAKSALLVQVGYDSSPRAVLEVLNDIVIRTAPRRILMTFFFGVLDPASQTLRFSSAGHLDPYVYRAATNELESLSSWGFPLGVKRREAFQEHTVEFGAGDRLVLYSDGLIEALDDDGDPFGFDRFEKTILDAGHLSADDMKKALLNAIRKFTRNRPPEDDQTLVVVAFEEPAAMRVPAPAFSAMTAGEAVN